MSFELPDTFTKVLSVNTQKIYIKFLNLLAEFGLDSVPILKRYSRRVCNTIKQLEPGNDEKSKWKRRVFISAVFWVAPINRKKPNPYSKLYDRSVPEAFAPR